MFKKILPLLAIFFISLPFTVWASPDISATAGILINARTAEVLWEKNAHVPMHPASTTKILTAVLLLENSSLSEKAMTSRRAALVRGSSLYLSEGQAITVEDLLYAIMLRSANDAAVVAAEHIAGSVQAFSVMMNQKARQAGARHSHFKNPHGLTEEGHLTTAYDLAMITRYAMGNPVFRKIAATSRHVIPWPGEDRTVVNEIPLLGNYEGMLGVKSGYTLEAKRTFVAAAGRDGLELIAVVLHAPGTRVWEDARILLDYGFQNFNVQKPLEKGEVLATRQARFGGPVSLVAAEDLEFTHPTGSGNMAVELRLQEKIKAPVAAGQALGEAIVFYDGKPVGSVALVSAGDVARAAPYTARFWFFTVLGTLFCLRGRKLYRDHKRRRRLLRKKRNSPRLSRRFKM